MTASAAVAKRHASVESFDKYLATGGDAVIPIQGAPRSFVFIHAAKPELGLRIEVDLKTEAPETGLRNIISRIATRNDVRYLEVVVTAPALFRDAYPVLCSMADRVQVAGMSPGDALRATLEKMTSLLRTPETMSREREVGLFGELLVMAGLIRELGATKATQAWRGGQSEEHDFGLAELDIEVKTTTSERRTHWIESLTQLMPTQDRPLWLVSHQITNAGSAGRTLPELVDGIRAAVSSSAAGRFEEALAASGWSDGYRDRLGTRWTPRTDSVAYLVTDGFPRLTPDSLRSNVFGLDRIVDVRYRISLDKLDSSTDMPKIIATAIAREGLT
ncbi:PD-(D/E)XK motif protein [Lentzea nigeriaca]|uniref:PD-(D/E)XK motif protein n=1 Tax=Lentzea nigeriaca TaxID=1128665 RepID=UPI001956CBFA|nr:PD-(D/E)XK motif protein [Lentzea nigeriaca]MBM7860566.1 hypothetical protein [Lentzea nigeriaca]